MRRNSRKLVLLNGLHWHGLHRLRCWQSHINTHSQSYWHHRWIPVQNQLIRSLWACVTISAVMGLLVGCSQFTNTRSDSFLKAVRATLTAYPTPTTAVIEVTRIVEVQRGDGSEAGERGDAGDGSNPSIHRPIFVVTADRVNLRAGPDASYQIQGTADAGHVFDIHMSNQEKSWWWVCCIEDELVWVVDVGGTIIGNTTDIARVSVPPATAAETP